MSPSQAALADWLATVRPWTHVATWTFGQRWPSGPTPTAVDLHVRRWLEDRDVADWFMVVERGTSGQRRCHAHGLLHGTGPLALPLDGAELWKDWSRRYGRCTFSPLRNSSAGIARYCAKYCFKGGLDGVSWDIQVRSEGRTPRTA